VKGGVEALSQMVKTTVPRGSDVTVVPAILQEYGVVTPPSPGPGGGGSPRRVSGERESSLADPHGSLAATDLQAIKKTVSKIYQVTISLVFSYCTITQIHISNSSLLWATARQIYGSIHLQSKKL
jgi:hypothetical protein